MYILETLRNSVHLTHNNFDYNIIRMTDKQLFFSLENFDFAKKGIIPSSTLFSICYYCKNNWKPMIAIWKMIFIYAELSCYLYICRRLYVDSQLFILIYHCYAHKYLLRFIVRSN